MVKYQIGGSLAANVATYVERAADTQLSQALLQRSFCYVLTSRQMGKSSLRVQMRHQLEAAGKGRCAVIDMTRIGSQQITQEQWYQGLAFDIARQLRSPQQFNIPLWWHSLGDLSPVQKLSPFIETVLRDDSIHPQISNTPIFSLS